MKTLFGRTLLGISSSLVLLSAIMGILLYLGLQRSVAVWNVNRTRHLQSTFSQQILRVSRQEGTLTEERLATALNHFLAPGVSTVIMTPERTPVFVYENGTRLDVTDGERVDPILDELGQIRNPALAVFDQDQLIAYVSVDTLGFRSDLSNRMFINSILVSIGTAIVLSLVLALLVAFVISRRLTRHARSLAVGLTDLARGNRSVTFPQSGAEELQTIADAALALQGQLSRGERLRKQWMQDIAHDLRTPVTALSSQLEGMIEGVLDPTPDRLRSVHRELQRVEELVRNLRELSRVESAELPLERRSLRLDRVVETAIDRMLHRHDAADTTWNVDVKPMTCFGDESLLLRSITNVLENALVHGEPGGPVDVTMERNRGVVRITVTNHGRIRDEDLPHLFDRLYRGDRGRSSPGSGLGLAISQAILYRHDGIISISQDGDRVRVVVELPGD